jgi:hypothetical protein
MDDAPSALMQLRFVTSESTFSYFEALDLYLAPHGKLVAFYSDKHTVFRVANQSAKSGHGMTLFGRALNGLNTEILCANSSQAKGRVERANRTHQDRFGQRTQVGRYLRQEGGEYLPAQLYTTLQRQFRKLQCVVLVLLLVSSHRLADILNKVSAKPSRPASKISGLTA